MASIDGFDVMSVVSPDGGLVAGFVPDANMLCPSLTLAGVELLAPGRGVRAYAERGKTMGIPLLHPWANRLAARRYSAAGKQVALPEPEGRYGLDPNGLPIHGAIPGLLRWRPVPREATDRLTARLEWRSTELLELFPFVHELELEVHAAERELTLVTILRATGDDAVPVSFGYHPYLRIPDVPRGDWTVTLGASQRLVTDDHMIPTGERAPLGTRRFELGDESWDDGLAGLDAVPEFTVSGGSDRLAVRFDEGYPFAQVYAPPGQDLICFEPMTAPTNALGDSADLPLARPGEEYRAAFTIVMAEN